MKSVFISRKLSVDSVFRAVLEAEGFDVADESLVDFQAVPFDSVPKTDWIFFYSKKSVEFFLKGFSQSTTQNPLFYVQIGTLGEGTAKTLEQYGFTPHFIGSGNPDTTASQFISLAQGTTVLFPCALNSKHSIEKKIQNKIKCLNLIVYINLPKPDCRMLSQHFLVFTSPLNVEAYFNKHQIQPHQKIVAIGETTAAALRGMGLCEVAVGERPTENCLAQRVIELSN